MGKYINGKRNVILKLLVKGSVLKVNLSMEKGMEKVPNIITKILWNLKVNIKMEKNGLGKEYDGPFWHRYLIFKGKYVNGEKMEKVRNMMIRVN